MKNKNVLFEQIKKYWLGYLLGIILVGIDGIVTYIYPYMITNIIDKALPNGDRKAVILNVIYMGLCQVISIIVTLLLSYVFCKISNKFILQLKHLLIDSMFEIEGKEIEKKSNLFITTMNSDINNIEMLSSRMLADLLMQIVTVIITAVILIKINKIIFLFMIIIYPILIFTQKFFNRIIIGQSKVVMERMDIGNGLINEFISYLYEYLVLNGQKYYSKRFGDNELKLRHDVLKQNMMMAFNRSIPKIISTCTFLIILALSSYDVIKGKMQPGELTIIIMYTQRMFNPLSSIMLVIGQLQKAKVSVNRINQIIGEVNVK